MGDLLLPDVIKVIIADDHEIVRVGIRRILSLHKQIQLLAEASNGEEAISLVKEYSPHIALLDISMPKIDGIEAAKYIKNNFPDVIVLILTAFEDSRFIERALEVGADGYLSKDISPQFLIEAIHKVLQGERVFSRSILRVLEQQPAIAYQAEETNPNITITKREQEILNYIALGKTSQEIADILNISLRTVQTHRSNIIQKLGIKSAAGLIRFAVLHSTKQNQ
jgi:DNA-binding NarL/FixJ family response regulator